MNKLSDLAIMGDFLMTLRAILSDLLHVQVPHTGHTLQHLISQRGRNLSTRLMWGIIYLNTQKPGIFISTTAANKKQQESNQMVFNRTPF